MSNDRKTVEDYDRQVMCSDCGSETGPFYRDTDDNDIICQDCLMGLPTSAHADFEQALEDSEYWEQTSNRNGLIILVCKECGEECGETFGDKDDDGALYSATEFLEKDEEHICCPCVVCGDKTNGSNKIDYDYYCDECAEEARREDGVG